MKSAINILANTPKPFTLTSIVKAMEEYKNQKPETPADLNEAAEQFADTDFVNNNFRDNPFNSHVGAFIAGAEWQKQQQTEVNGQELISTIETLLRRYNEAFQSVWTTTTFEQLSEVIAARAAVKNYLNLTSK